MRTAAALLDALLHLLEPLETTPPGHARYALFDECEPLLASLAAHVATADLEALAAHLRALAHLDASEGLSDLERAAAARGLLRRLRAGC